MNNNCIFYPTTYSQAYVPAVFLLDSVIDDCTIEVSEDLKTITIENYITKDSAAFDIDDLNDLIDSSPDPRISLLLLIELASR